MIMIIEFALSKLEIKMRLGVCNFFDCFLVDLFYDRCRGGYIYLCHSINTLCEVMVVLCSKRIPFSFQSIWFILQVIYI